MVIDMEKSFFIIGSYFASLLTPQLSKHLNKAGEAYIFPEENECVEHYVKRVSSELREQLPVCNPDYLVIELQTLLQLFCYEDQNQYLTEKSLVDEAFDELLSVIREHFPENRVFLIQTHVPKYYIMSEDLIRKVPAYLKKEEAVTILNQYEKYVQEEAGGILLNTTSFYFYKKKRGYLINNRTYEDECYFDISSKISNYVIKGKKISKTFHPLCSIDRYVKYAGKTIEWNALKVFFNKKNLIDQLILSAPVTFVKQYKKKLQTARRLSVADFDEWKQNVSKAFADDQEFRNILIAFYATNHDIFQDDNISYKELFKNSIVSRYVLDVIQSYVKKSEIADPNQINPHNAGYYYSLMNGKSKEEALEYVGDNITIDPVLVDVYGSCISRNCLRERYADNTTLSVNKNWFLVPMYVEPQEKVEYDSGIFDQLKGLHTENVRLQFEHKVLEDVRASKAKWVLIDLYGMFAYIYQYKGFLYSDFQGIISKRLGSKRVNVLQDSTLFDDWNDILSRTDIWINTIKEKYGDRIILVQTHCSYLSKGDDNVIYSPRNKKRLTEQQSFLDMAFSYVKEKLNCYTIEISKEFCPDDCGFPERNPVHYSYDFYRQASKLIENIVYNEPKQKSFDSYDHDVRIKRMADMLEHNEIATVRRFFARPLDDVVLRLSAETIRQYKKVIASWYEQSINGEEELLRNWKEEWGISLKNEIIDSTTREITTNPVLLGDYPKEPFHMTQ